MHILGILRHPAAGYGAIGAGMSVRFGLLAILDQGPCYGYQLRTEFDRRTGSAAPLNVGQIYRTLERLERDGLVTKGETDARGHVYYAITDAGSAAVASSLTTPIRRPVRDEVALGLAVAATLPGVDAFAAIAAQRRETAARLDALRAERGAADDADPRAFARVLIADSALYAAEAELRWLEAAAARLARHPDVSIPLEPSGARPGRGRPRLR